MPRETHNIFTNEGATSPVTITLPNPTPAGQVYHFINVAGTEFKILSTSKDILYGGSLTTHLTSYLAGATLSLVSTGTRWLAFCHNNLWRPEDLPPLYTDFGALMTPNNTYSSEISHIPHKPTLTLVVPANEFVASPIRISTPGRFAIQLGVYVNTAESANINLAVYTSNKNLKPEKRIAITGNISLGTTGWRYSSNLDVTFPYPGLYFLAHNSNSAGTARVKGWSYPFALSLSAEYAGNNPLCAYRKSQAYLNPLPDPAPQDGNFDTGDIVAISLKVVSWL
jgi:hypothetical protein